MKLNGMETVQESTTVHVLKKCAKRALQELGSMYGELTARLSRRGLAGKQDTPLPAMQNWQRLADSEGGVRFEAAESCSGYDEAKRGTYLKEQEERRRSQKDAKPKQASDVPTETE